MPPPLARPAATGRFEVAVLFEDTWLLALDKPSGLLAHADSGVASALQWARDRESTCGRDPASLHLVHRLDRETSGVLLFARTAEVAEACNLAFRERKVLKMYLALCAPVPSLRWLTVSQHLRPVRVGAGEKMTVVTEGGVEASSEIEVLARGRRFGLVRVIPDQGRKHQVRVALAANGAPIAGDFLYGGSLSKNLAPRLMLHARTLELRHPQSGEHLVIRAAVPKDFKQLLSDDGGSLPTDIDARHRVVANKYATPGAVTAGKAQAGAEALPRMRTERRKRPAGPGR